MSSQGVLLSCQLPTLSVSYLSGTWLLCHPYGIPVALCSWPLQPPIILTNVTLPFIQVTTVLKVTAPNHASSGF